jgi:thiol-disulfide isomerase/thioredoxin
MGTLDRQAVRGSGQMLARGILMVMVLSLSLSAVGCSGSSNAPKAITGDCELRLHSNGEVARLSDFKGKTVFFHVWATWCGPCVMELPSVVRLADQFKDDPNVRFVLVSIDQKLDELDAFIEAKGLSLPVYTLQSSLPPELQTEGIPATFFIDRMSKIRRVQEGSYQWDRQSVVNELRQLSEESTASTKVAISP